MIYKLAFLNLWRHRTRSILSLLIISSAIASIMMFRGQSHYILEKLRVYGAENQYGHLQIGSKKLWSPESQKIKDQLIELNPEIQKKIQQDPAVKMFSPRLSAQGLLNFSESQFVAKLVGLDPEQETNFLESFRMVEGRPLSKNTDMEIILGSGLQKRLKVKTGETITVVTQTINGVVNAADLTVAGVFTTAVAELDNQIAFVPLKVIQNLLDTEKVEVWFLRLNDYSETASQKSKIENYVKDLQPELTVKSWRDLADYYNQVEQFYGIQNMIIQVILITLTILAILNTVGMTVHERTGEIGTQRALGLKRTDIIAQFTLEGIFLAFFGALCGSLLGTVSIYAFNSAKLMVSMPGASDKVLVQADLLPSAILLGSGLGFLATMIGTLLPAYRAAQISVVDALRRNI